MAAENPGPKPSLDQVLPEVFSREVKTPCCSRGPSSTWARPSGKRDLQAEVEDNPHRATRLQIPRKYSRRWTTPDSRRRVPGAPFWPTVDPECVRRPSLPQALKVGRAILAGMRPPPTEGRWEASTASQSGCLVADDPGEPPCRQVRA
jgi:hypothetical protein